MDDFSIVSVIKVLHNTIKLSEKYFVLVPKRCVFDLWEAFNDIAEGFGLTIEEFAEILKSATMEFLQATEKNLGPDIDALFRLLDDDSVSAFHHFFSSTMLHFGYI
ncbi:hypothetical protein EON64_05560 [archaeon]|nr:MAG: hypothetical protein EON64_05560 [archaeon]